MKQLIVRYFAIVYPLQSSIWIETHTNHIIASIWMIGTLLGSPQLIQGRVTEFRYGGHLFYDCREEWEGELAGKLYTAVLFGVTFIFPLLALSFLYGSIGITMMKRISPGNANISRDESQLLVKIKVRSNRLTL